MSLRQTRALSRAVTPRELQVLAELRLKLALVLCRDDEIREASLLAKLVEEPTGRDLLVRAAIRDCVRASQHELSNTWRFELVPRLSQLAVARRLTGVLRKRAELSQCGEFASGLTRMRVRPAPRNREETQQIWEMRI